MRALITSLIPSIALGTCIALVACAKTDDTAPPTTPQQGAYPPGQYPPAPGTYPQQYPPQQQYPQPQPYPQQVPTAAAPVAPVPPATGGQMATPNAFALPCQNDQACGLGKCNVQFQKCAFPCQTAVDCAQGATCNTMTGLCLPGGS